ncbi:MAG: hypothetical protein WC975_05475 [Phycisphaerae bacterium]
MKKMFKYLLTISMVLVLTGALSAIAGCEKREYHRHEEKTQKDVVIDEGPVVE